MLPCQGRVGCLALVKFTLHPCVSYGKSYAKAQCIPLCSIPSLRGCEKKSARADAATTQFP